MQNCDKDDDKRVYEGENIIYNTDTVEFSEKKNIYAEDSSIYGAQTGIYNSKPMATNSSPFSMQYESYSQILDKEAVINEYWAREIDKIKKNHLNFKSVKLPLARIKRLMKVEENVKIIAQEVPVLFALVTEKFVEELTLRAWMHTKEGKRKILQGSDVTKAVKTTHMYDFLGEIIAESRGEMFRTENGKK